MSELEIRPVAGTDGERTLGWFFDWHHDWDSFTSGCNWRDFTLLHFGGEWNEMTGRVEVELVVLGLGGRVTYVYNDEFAREMMARRDDFNTRLDTPAASSLLEDSKNG